MNCPKCGKPGGIETVLPGVYVCSTTPETVGGYSLDVPGCGYAWRTKPVRISASQLTWDEIAEMEARILTDFCRAIFEQLDREFTDGPQPS